MDEMRINSSIMKKIIASLIRKSVSKKLGVSPVIKFNDEIKVTVSDDQVRLHLNCDIACKPQEFEKLLGA